MATTRLITHHISKGETIAQSLTDLFDYGQNLDKTQQGEIIQYDLTKKQASLRSDHWLHDPKQCVIFD